MRYQNISTPVKAYRQPLQANDKPQEEKLDTYPCEKQGESNPFDLGYQLKPNARRALQPQRAIQV
jgi:hypothetical protein